MGALERLPKWAICIPLVLQWLWLSLRYGSSTLPSSANPAITAGGLVGETKSEYFRAMGPVAQSATAPWCVVPSASQAAGADIADAMAKAGLAFPVIAKPDLGMCGFGVCLLADETQLAAYVRGFPAGQALVLQAWLPQQGEAGVFYAREPGAEGGRLIGLALRLYPRVTGDGRSSVGDLMRADPRAHRVHGRADHAPGIDLGRVPAAGEVVRLSVIGSTRVGGLYLDGGEHITPELTAAIDAIARDMRDFHFGRFDLRYATLGELRRGEGLRIMEVNGAGSEAIEAWDPKHRLLPALRLIFAKQRTLFAIGAANRKRGHRPIGLRALARLHVMQQKLLDAYPPSN